MTPPRPGDPRTPDPARDPDADTAAQELAQRCADAMWERDRASRRLGMSRPVVAPGRATLTLLVGADLLNGQGYCHGGYLATLADTAFAFACNTGNEVTVAAGFDIVFVRPAREGDVVRASAVERARFGRSGLYDVTITRSDGELIAEFRGRSRSLGRPLLPGHPGPGRPAG